MNFEPENIESIEFLVKCKDGSSVHIDVPHPEKVQVDMDAEQRDVTVEPWPGWEFLLNENIPIPGSSPFPRRAAYIATSLVFTLKWNPRFLGDIRPEHDKLFIMKQIPATPEQVRPSKVEWGVMGAEWASSRGECTRRKVGAIVLDTDGRTVGTGYNGAPAGRRSCLDGACPRASSGVEPGSSYDTGPGSCIAIHAEANALIDAGRLARGGELFISTEPCDGCLRLAQGAGIAWVHYRKKNGTVDSSPIR